MLKSIPAIAAASLLALTLGACAPEAAESEAGEEALAAEASPSPEPTAEATPKPAAPVPVAAARPAAPPPPPVCYECGTVTSITEVKQKGQGSGAGAVAGAVAGGVAGHQVGGGRGKDVATVAGAILGAMAGHEIEKRARATTSYDVAIAMEPGGQRVINVTELGGLTVGAPVRVEGNNIFLR